MSLATIFFGVELYHVMSHIMVLTGTRMLPRKDLVKQRLYFLFDLLSATTSYFIHGRALVLMILQNIQHAFYVFTWEESWAAKRVISWSSLDWDRGRWNQLDLVTGTLFDIFVHTLNTYFLGQLISNREMMITLAVVAILLVVVFWNPKFAWSSYRGTHGWVKKRMHPLSDDQRQEMKSIEKLAEKLIGIQ